MDTSHLCGRSTALSGARWGSQGLLLCAPSSAPSVFGRFDHMAELAGYAQGVQFVSLSSSPTWRPNTVKPYACTVHTSHVYGYRGLCAVRKYERPLGRSLVRLLVRLHKARRASIAHINQEVHSAPAPTASGSARADSGTVHFAKHGLRRVVTFGGVPRTCCTYHVSSMVCHVEIAGRSPWYVKIAIDVCRDSRASPLLM